MRDLEDTAAWADHPRVPRRNPTAEAQIADARGPEETPLDELAEYERHVAGLRANGQVSSFKDAAVGETTVSRHAEVLAAHPPADPVLTLTGDEAHHYRRLQAAAKRALDTQNAHATAGADLREAIQALCKAMAPGA